MSDWFRQGSLSDDMDAGRAAEFYQRGEFAEALRRVDVMLAAGPHIALSWRFKGECLFQMDRLAEAEACFRRAYEIGGPGTEEVMVWAALCQYNAGQRDTAARTMRGYIAALPAGAGERRQQAERALLAFQGRADAYRPGA